MSSCNNGGRHNTTNQCRRRQCSQSLLSLLAACGVDLPCHWCCGCLGIGPRWSLIAARCSVLLAVPCLRSTERNADPQTPNPRASLPQKAEKRAEHPHAGTKTSSALHAIPTSTCACQTTAAAVDAAAAWISTMVPWRMAYLIETGNGKTLLAGVDMTFAFAVQHSGSL